MGKVLIRFYEELNDYLPPGKRKRDFEVLLNGNETVGQIVERLGLDVFFREGLGREKILLAAKEERRILLTQQSDLQGSREFDRMIVLSPGSLHEQIHQIIDALDLGIEPAQKS
jgi:hypothetical protein